MRQKLILLFSALMPGLVYAIPCYLTMVKDSCWTNYAVTVTMMDASNAKQVLQVEVPKGQSWVRQGFTCDPAQTFLFKAQFSPTIWGDQAGLFYASQQYWQLPEQLKANETAWNLVLCFPKQFSSVPLPPTAGQHCACEMEHVPPISS